MTESESLSETLKWQIASILVIFATSFAAYISTLFLIRKSENSIDLKRTGNGPFELFDHDHRNDHCDLEICSKNEFVVNTQGSNTEFMHDHSPANVDHLTNGSLPISNKSRFFNCLKTLIKSFSAGIIFGVATMHLLAEGQEMLSEYYPDYPLGLALFSTGILVTLCIDHIAFYFLDVLNNKKGDQISTTSNDETSLQTPSCAHYSCSGETSCSLELSEVPINPINKNRKSQLSEQNNEKFNKQKDLVNSIVLEAGIAVHSIVMGFAMGALSNTEHEEENGGEHEEEHGHEIEILFAVYIIHQVFEGVGLAAIIEKTDLDFNIKVLFGLVFSLTLPIGIILGMNVSSGDLLSEGAANTIAAGSLLYTAMVEMVAEDFNKVPKGDATLKFGMFVSLSAGFAVMAVLSIWG